MRKLPGASEIPQCGGHLFRSSLRTVLQHPRTSGRFSGCYKTFRVEKNLFCLLLASAISVPHESQLQRKLTPIPSLSWQWPKMYLSYPSYPKSSPSHPPPPPHTPCFSLPRNLSLAIPECFSEERRASFHFGAGYQNVSKSCGFISLGTDGGGCGLSWGPREGTGLSWRK